MARSYSTTHRISDALRLGDSHAPEDCKTDVFYDSLQKIWLAQFVNSERHQVGFLGLGRDAISAVEHLISFSSNSHKSIR